MDDSFELHELWHALRQAPERLTFYELLGLPLFSNDPTRIADAYQRRFAVLHRYEGGKYQEQTQQLIEALSAAYHCLSHAAHKRDYDEQLRLCWAAQATQVDVPAAAETVAELPAPPAPRPVLSEAPCNPLPAVGTSGVRDSSRSGAPAAVASWLTPETQPRVATCGCCAAQVPTPAGQTVLPVDILRTGDVVSAACRIKRRTTSLSIECRVDAQPVVGAIPQPDPCLSSFGLAVCTTGIGLVPSLVCLLLQCLTGDDYLAPLLVLLTLSVVGTGAVGFWYIPPMATPEAVAWGWLLPRLLTAPCGAQQLGFVAGLAEACVRAQARTAGRHRSRLAGRYQERVQRRIAQRRAPILAKAIEHCEDAVSQGLVGYHHVGLLYQLALRDQLQVLGNAPRFLQLWEPLLAKCLGSKLPLACLDIATYGLNFTGRLPQPLLWRMRLHCYRTCHAEGLSEQDTLTLRRRSSSLDQLFAVPPHATARAVAFTYALQEACPSGLRPFGGATVFEFDSPAAWRLWQRQPDLLAISDDRTLQWRYSGFYFRDVQFLARPAVRIQPVTTFVQTGWRSPSDGEPDSLPENRVAAGYLKTTGYHLVLDRQLYYYRRYPGAIAERVTNWATYYFDRVWEGAWQQLSRPLSPERLEQLHGMWLTCPGCGRLLDFREHEIAVPIVMGPQT